MSQA
jgi:hypothetical protein